MSLSFRLTSSLLAAVALLCAPGVSAQSVDEEIAKRVAMVEIAVDTSIRIDRAAHLAEYIASRRPLDVSNIQAPVVDHIAGLLDDEIDLVRFYAAASLGFLGASARRAIPALERALARREAERGIVFGLPRVYTSPVSSVQAICAALAKIDLGRVPGVCQTYR